MSEDSSCRVHDPISGKASVLTFVKLEVKDLRKSQNITLGEPLGLRRLRRLRRQN